MLFLSNSSRRRATNRAALQRLGVGAADVSVQGWDR